MARSGSEPTGAIAGGSFQVRFHGRGGQGVVTAAELLSVAAFLDGRYSQAFPSFGSERAGAPVVAFCRISDTEIRTRAPVTSPQALIVQDATLLHQIDLFSGLVEDGYVLVNTARAASELGLGQEHGQVRADRIVTVAASDLARTHLGRPLPNAALLGGLSALCGVVSLDGVVAAIEDRFSGRLGEANAAAAREAHGLVLAAKEVSAGAATD